MYSQLIYLHFGGSYTSSTQLEAEIHALEYKCASNTGPFSLLFLIPKMTYYFRMFFYSHLLNNWSSTKHRFENCFGKVISLAI